MSEIKKGIESLRASVIHDCTGGQNCFNEKGCDHEFQRMVPQDNPELLKMGMKRSCISVSKCFHKYCDKYKWVLDRAAHYAEKCGKTSEEVIEIWEKDRSYWYMNYYQECNQPLLTSEKIVLYEDWKNELESRFGKNPNKWAFVCPSCGHIQTKEDFIAAGKEDGSPYYNCIGRYKSGVGCDWTLGGLLSIHTTSVLKDAQVFPVFEMAPADYAKKGGQA